jgi:hypothetical protein
MNGSLIDESKKMKDPLGAINQDLLVVLYNDSAQSKEIRQAITDFRNKYESAHGNQAAYWLLLSVSYELAHPRAYDHLAGSCRNIARSCEDITPLLKVYYMIFLIERLKKREARSTGDMSGRIRDHVERCRTHAEYLLEDILLESTDIQTVR